MTRQLLIPILVALFLLTSGCGAADTGRISDSSGSTPGTTQTTEQALQATSTSAASEATAAIELQASHKGKLMDRAAIEQAVKADLAKYLQVAAAQITVIETAEHTWPDQGLGCTTSPGVFEPVSTPGYLVRLKHDNETHAYHTDLHGRFLRCVDMGKPLGPITR